MQAIIDQFRERGVLDELGFGTIRDSFSDLFFPGITTIQTRARYLLFVPWIHQRAEREASGYAEAAQRASKYQAQLAQALVNGGEGEAQGVIGIQAGEALKRPAADVYWTALATYGIWQFPRGLSGYYAVKQQVREAGAAVRADDGDVIAESRLRGWDPGLPKAPDIFLRKACFKLTRHEADYLVRRMTDVPRGETLLAHCLRSRSRIDRIEFPWLHPDQTDFPARLRWQLVHAELFSLVAEGAVLLYQLLIATKKRASQEEDLRHQLGVWAMRAVAQSTDLQSWDMPEFWRTVAIKRPRVSDPTRRFVQALIASVRRDPVGFVDDVGVHREIQARERNLKPGRARLTDQRALDLWDGPSGLGRQTYRWPNVRRIVGDIQGSLRRADRIPDDA